MAVSALCAGGLRAAPPARSRPAHTFTRPPAARRRRASAGAASIARLGPASAPGCTAARSRLACSTRRAHTRHPFQADWGRAAARLHQRLHLVRKALRGAQDAQAAQRRHRTSRAQVCQGATWPPAPGVQALLADPLGARLRRAQPQRAHQRAHARAARLRAAAGSGPQAGRPAGAGRRLCGPRRRGEQAQEWHAAACSPRGARLRQALVQRPRAAGGRERRQRAHGSLRLRAGPGRGGGGGGGSALRVAPGWRGRLRACLAARSGGLQRWPGTLGGRRGESIGPASSVRNTTTSSTALCTSSAQACLCAAGMPTATQPSCVQVAMRRQALQSRQRTPGHAWGLRPLLGARAGAGAWDSSASLSPLTPPAGPTAARCLCLHPCCRAGHGPGGRLRFKCGSCLAAGGCQQQSAGSVLLHSRCSGLCARCGAHWRIT